MVVTPSFTHLSMTFSNRRFSNCSPTVDVGFVKLTWDSFCGNRVFKMHIQFYCHQCCNNSVIFGTILLNIRRSLSINFYFCPLFLFADVFPRFVCANITLETVALDTPNNTAVSHRLSLNTITNELTRALQSAKKKRKNIQCCQLKLFHCSQHKFYSSVSKCFKFFVYPLCNYAANESTISWKGPKTLQSFQ
jgi:hypothetical protein